MRNEKDQFVEEFLSVEPPVEAKKNVPNLEDEITDNNLHCEASGDRALIKKVIAALSTVYDPEIPVNIYDLGLVYKLTINDDNFVNIEMTLTAPGCPVAHLFPSMVRGAVESVEDISGAEVEIVWDPPWTQDRMTEAAKLELGMF
jgi:FeS assembly SUF system protein